MDSQFFLQQMQITEIIRSMKKKQNVHYNIELSEFCLIQSLKSLGNFYFITTMSFKNRLKLIPIAPKMYSRLEIGNSISTYTLDAAQESGFHNMNLKTFQRAISMRPLVLRTFT